MEVARREDHGDYAGDHTSKNQPEIASRLPADSAAPATPGLELIDTGNTAARPVLNLDQTATPYLDALRAYGDREPGRFHVPGHKGGAGADPSLVQSLGRDTLAMDLPLIIDGVDVGAEPAPLEQAQILAAQAWGAKRTWFLTNGATQGNHAISLALAQLGGDVVMQRNAHFSMVSGLVLSGLRPKWVAPELNPLLGIAHCVTPTALDLALADTPNAVAAVVVSPTYYGAVADVRALAEVAHSWGVPLVVDEAWGPHLHFHETLPEDALEAGADLVLSGTHKLMGSLTQSAMLHISDRREFALLEPAVERAMSLVTSTSPSSLLFASLDSARRLASGQGRVMAEKAMRALDATRKSIADIPGLAVIDENLIKYPGVHDFDPLKLSVDIHELGSTGYEVAEHLRVDHDINIELCSENMLVAVFGLAEPVAEQGDRLVAALGEVAGQLAHGTTADRKAPVGPPPHWGPFAITPREAYLGRHESVPVDQAVGRICAEAIAAYPPGVPNAMPGERLTAATIQFIKRTIEHGGSVRGISDPSFQSIRVLCENGSAQDMPDGDEH